MRLAWYLRGINGFDPIALDMVVGEGTQQVVNTVKFGLYDESRSVKQAS